MKIRSAKATAAAVAAFAAVAAPAHAQLEVSPVTDLSLGGQPAGDPRVAVGATGVGAAVWQRSNGADLIVQSARFTGGWTPAEDRTPAGANAEQQQVAAGPDGSIMSVWRRNEGGTWVVQASRFAGGAWSPVVNLSDPAGGGNATQPHVAVGPDGRAIATWSRYDGTSLRVQARHFDGTAWGAVSDLSPAGADATQPRVAIDAAGIGTVAWTRDDDADQVIQVSRAFPGGAWSPAATLSDAGVSSVRPAVTAGPTGTATVAWQRNQGEQYLIRASRLQGSAWTSPATVSVPTDQSFDPEIASTRSGDVTVAWRRVDPVSSMKIQASRSTATGWTVPVSLSANGRDAAEPRVAIARDGAITVAWRRSDGANQRVQVVRFVDGGWSLPVNISPAGADATNPDLAAGPDGVATVVWRLAQGPDNAVIQSVRYRISSLGPAGDVNDPSTGGQPPVVPIPPGSLTCPAPAAPSGNPDAIRLSAAQLRINQRISAAAVRRVNALAARVEGRPAPEAGNRQPDRIVLSAAQLRINQRISAAAVRRVNALAARLEGRPAPEAGDRQPDRIVLSAAQLRINQRISSAAVRRVNALQRCVDAAR